MRSKLTFRIVSIATRTFSRVITATPMAVIIPWSLWLPGPLSLLILLHDALKYFDDPTSFIVRPLKYFDHAVNAVSEHVLFVPTAACDLSHVALHFRPQVRLIEVDPYFLVGQDQTQPELLRQDVRSLLASVATLLNRLDVLVDRCVGPNTVYIHLGD